MRQTKVAIPGMIALALIVLIAYLPALQAGYLWDDREYVVENSNLVRPDGWRRIWLEPQHMVQYYPLVHTVLRVEHSLWQSRPRGYHLVNILLHALNAILLWMILERLAVPGAWLIAAFFGIHPLQVESVAWITEIKNLLSGLFYFLAVAAYLRFHAARAGVRSTPGRTSGSAPAWRFYCLSLGLFLLALFSKTTVVTLPAVLLVVVWWKSTALRRSDFLPLVPMFLLAAGFGAFTWWLETHHVGSENAVLLSTWDRLLVPGRAAWFYIGKLLWPVDLCFVYPRWTVHPGVWWQYLFPLGAAAVIATLWLQREHLGKGPLAAVLFYLLTLAPVSGAVRFYFLLYSFVGDHFQYLASIGIIALAVAPAARWIAGRRSPRLPVLVRRSVPALLLAILAVLTWNRAKIYRNEETVWRDTVVKNPAAWIAHNNLGVISMRQGRKPEAIGHFVEALRYNSNSPEAHSNLGALYQGQGEAARAIEEFRTATALKPILYDAQYDLGVLLMQRGEREEATRHFMEAIKYKPTMADAHMMLGDIFVAQGQLDLALEKYRTALAINPSMAQVYSRLGWVLTNQGSFPEARTALVRAIQLNPKHADTQALLGVVLEKLGDKPGALRQYQRALELNPQTEIAKEGLNRLSAQN